MLVRRVLDNKCPLLKKLSNSICDAMNIGLHKPILDNYVRNQAIIIQNLEIFGQFSGVSGQNCPKRLLLQVKIDSQERRLDNFMRYCGKLSNLPPMQPVYEEFLSANRKRENSWVPIMPERRAKGINPLSADHA